MLPGDTVRVQVHIEYIAGPVYFALCDEASCSSVKVVGYKKGVMGYSTWRVHVNSPNPWAGESEKVTSQEKPWLFTKSDTFVVRVSLRLDEVLAVSIEGAAEAGAQDAVVATLQTQRGQQDLKILSYGGSAVLLDQARQSTDGHVMSVGEVVSVRLCATGPGNLVVGLCGAKSCSYVAVYGVDQDGQLRYGTGVSLQRNQLTGLSEWIEQPNRTDSTFVAGERRSFVVSRCSESEMQFWQEGDDTRVISVPLDRERSVLKELGMSANVILRSTGDETHFCPVPDTPAPPTYAPTTYAPNTDAPPRTTTGSASTPPPSGAAPVAAASNVAALLTAALLYLAH